MATEGGSEILGANLPETKSLVGVVVGSLALGAYAAWITAEVIPRGIAFVFVAVGVAGTLYSKEDARLAYAGYVLAGLFFLTPVMMVLPRAVSAGAYGRGVAELVLTTANLVLFAVFVVLAGAVAYLSLSLSHRTG